VRIAVDEAQAKGGRLHDVGLDLVEAFDTIPNEFVAHNVQRLLQIDAMEKFCPPRIHEVRQRTSKIGLLF
jgi:hypothetical protein